jgi:hypothetical protein
MKEEEDRKPKWDIDKECPNSALVDYKWQVTQFFKAIKALLVEGSIPNTIWQMNMSLQ